MNGASGFSRRLGKQVTQLSLFQTIRKGITFLNMHNQQGFKTVRLSSYVILSVCNGQWYCHRVGRLTGVKSD